LKGLLPCNSAAPALTTESTPSPTILPTVLLALSTALSLDDDDDDDDPALLGLTFLEALLVTFFAVSLALGAAFFAILGVQADLLILSVAVAAVAFGFAAAFIAVSSGFAAAFFAVALGFAAAFLAVVVAFFFVGDFFFLVTPAALVRGPAPAVFFFFFSGEGAAGFCASGLAFSLGGEDGLVCVIA
jgi:hypothetical protein